MPTLRKRKSAAPFDLPRRVVYETGKTVPGQIAYLELMRTADGMRTETGALFSAHGLSGKQYNALRAIRRAGDDGALIGQIQAELVEIGPDTTRLVDRLERAGLVTRLRGTDDRRAVKVLLTSEGHKVLKALDAPLVALHQAQFARLTKADITSLLTLMRKIRAE
jgi:DNA-binding MarR family transcriptional regulator